MARSFRKRFGLNFFEVDIIDEFGNVTERVGTAEERIIRRQALTVRKIARRSMRRKRRYRSVEAMPIELQIVFKRKRSAWHMMGEKPQYEPLPMHLSVPSRPGTPPGVVRGQLKKFLFAEKSSKSFLNRARGTSFVVGPKLLPDKKDIGATTPEVHEYGGTRVNTTGEFGRARTAKYPKRQYMEPALKIAQPRFAAMWKNQVKP